MLKKLGAPLSLIGIWSFESSDLKLFWKEHRKKLSSTQQHNGQLFKMCCRDSIWQMCINEIIISLCLRQKCKQQSSRFSGDPDWAPKGRAPLSTAASETCERSLALGGTHQTHPKKGLSFNARVKITSWKQQKKMHDRETENDFNFALLQNRIEHCMEMCRIYPVTTSILGHVQTNSSILFIFTIQEENHHAF